MGQGGGREGGGSLGGFKQGLGQHVVQKLVGAVVWMNWRSRGEAGDAEGLLWTSREPVFRAALRVGDLGNRVRQPKRVGWPRIHLPPACRSRAQSSWAQDSGVIFHMTSLRERAAMAKAIINVHLPPNNPFFSRLDRLLCPERNLFWLQPLRRQVDGR